MDAAQLVPALCRRRVFLERRAQLLRRIGRSLEPVGVPRRALAVACHLWCAAALCIVLPAEHLSRHSLHRLVVACLLVHRAQLAGKVAQCVSPRLAGHLAAAGVAQATRPFQQLGSQREALEPARVARCHQQVAWYQRADHLVVWRGASFERQVHRRHALRSLRRAVQHLGQRQVVLWRGQLRQPLGAAPLAALCALLPLHALRGLGKALRVELLRLWPAPERHAAKGGACVRLPRRLRAPPGRAQHVAKATQRPRVLARAALATRAPQRQAHGSTRTRWALQAPTRE
mmetsp:Transcript_1044/g.2987  ORF Transcript_1044/g.2987 Transcript_1044/m.2987 type:complete len:288 (-) Transcript_1044:175-1038(-)